MIINVTYQLRTGRGPREARQLRSFPTARDVAFAIPDITYSRYYIWHYSSSCREGCGCPTCCKMQSEWFGFGQRNSISYHSFRIMVFASTFHRFTSLHVACYPVPFNFLIWSTEFLYQFWILSALLEGSMEVLNGTMIRARPVWHTRIVLLTCSRLLCACARSGCDYGRR